MKNLWLWFHIMLVICMLFVTITLTENASKNNDEADKMLENNLNEDEMEPFVPTNEWQEVKSGQAIPRGLHVKMDMKNGGRWAKLLDKNGGGIETSTAQLQVVAEKKDVVPGEETRDTSDKVASYKIKELKEALKKFKDEKSFDTKPDNADEIKSTFRSIKEIRETFDQLDLKQESDVEVMKKLVATLQDADAELKKKHLALQDLEYYVHQIDNANDLVNFGGFAIVVSCLNHSDTSIREEAAHVLGSAMQSNPSVQIKAIQSGVLGKLLQILSNQQQPVAVRKKCLFAISSLVRHFPIAQLKLSEYGGFQVLISLFHQDGVTDLQFKAIRLVNDLIEERLNAEKPEEDNEKHNERRKQYNRLPLGRHIEELGWCSAISSSLQAEAHNQRESVLAAMKNLHQYCQNEFQKPSVVNMLLKYKDEYTKLTDEDIKNGETDSYFKLLLEMTNQVLHLTNTKNSKDEL